MASRDVKTEELIAKTADLIRRSALGGSLQKAVLSKPADSTVRRSALSLRALGDKTVLQLETMHADNKATHRNLPAEEWEDLDGILRGYRQINLITDGGECELRLSASGNGILIGEKKVEAFLAQAAPTDANLQSNNREKHYILKGDEPFLVKLGVSEPNGRVHDKKQAKFRQINRFLELVSDIVPSLPKEGTLRILDLCCGKSYLSFAVYHYFTCVLGREVYMTGMDLKPDVIAFCAKVAGELGFGGLEFLQGDITAYDPGERVDLVVSLHACDIATDIVLEKAVASHAKVILSTPCCHHEMNKRLACPELSFLSDYSMLRQKLCDAATDALRLRWLESEGYRVAALELIDPEDTPKNVLLRAVRKPHFDKASPEALALREKYEAARRFLLPGENPEGAKAGR